MAGEKRLVTLLALAIVSGMFLLSAGIAGAQEKPVSLVIVGDGGSVQLPLFWYKDQIKDEFNVDLKIVSTSFEDLYTKLKAEFVGETGAYDIAVIYPKFLGDFVANGYLIPITQYAAKQDPDLADIIPAYLDLYGKMGRDLYALPYDGDVLALFYRKDLLADPVEKSAFKKKYGYELTVPETWDQYLDVAEFFTRKAGETLAGKKLDSDFYGTATYGQKDFVYAWWLNYFGSLGGVYFDREMNPEINSPAGIEALKRQKAQLKYCPPEVITYGFDELQGIFLSGHSAMSINWTDPGRVGENPQYSDIPGLVGTALMPGSKVGGKVIHSAALAAGRAITITKWCKHPYKAYQVAKFLSLDVGLPSVSSTISGLDPYRYSHFNSAGSFAKFSDTATARGFLDGVRQNLENGYPELTLPAAEQYLEALGLGVRKYLTSENVSPEEALNEVAKKWDSITNALGRDQMKQLYGELLKTWKETGYGLKL